LSTASQLQSQAAIANTAIQSATQSLSNANSAYQNALSNAISNFSTCALQAGPFLAPFFAVGCGSQLTSTALSSISQAFTAAIQPFTQLLGLSIDSFAATVIPLITSKAQQLQQTLQASANQAATISQQAATCISQAVKSTAVGANATATTAGANATVTTVGANATVTTGGANATATTVGANATVTTVGANATATTVGANTTSTTVATPSG
jgi:hypothetical protein